MEISLFSKNLNTLTANTRLGIKSSDFSFRNILSQEGMSHFQSTESQLNSSTDHEIISFSGIIKDLTKLLKQLPLDMNTSEIESVDEGFYNSLNKLDLISNDNNFIEMTPILFLLNNEINDVFAENPSMNALFDKLETQPSVVSLLSMVKAVESFNELQSDDVHSLLSDVNTYLEQVFPSFENNETPSLENMLQSISKMNSNDLAILEGEVILDRFINQGSDKTHVLNKLLTIGNGLFERNHGLLRTNLHLKKDIIDQLKSISISSDSLALIENVVNISDVQTLRTIFLNTVKRHLQSNGNDQKQILNDFEDFAEYFRAITKSEKENNIKLSLTETVRFNEDQQFYKEIGLKSTLIENNRNVISLGKNKEISLVQMIHNPIENNLQVEKFINELKEQTLVLQLKHTSGIENESQGSTKLDSSIRQEFTNQLLNAFKNSKFAQMPNGANRLILKLNPEHLGVITVKLIQKNGEMIARLITSSGSAKELLDQSIHQLKQVLPNVQIDIERFDIQTEQTQKTVKDQSENREDRNNEKQQETHDDDNNNEQSFMESLRAALNKTV
ncbi:flagellar hook-length control protein FliK [Metabacillus halosaccharovorans]|uniref:flagellar hook-length control protein FliK n=1 Tax=Metabacillus halosaccharovorans TaxID=930124 RepID=UPI00203B3816|nr:flagellar hook-length control protein FliK [Metabacillus halosaccharovorans]MCM3441096.1 flagellar hook-length control protein FliK [Metabacillus halosaccharovorans]